MKNQYFGDINDYKKYGLLRLLGGNGQIKTVVCWALTEDDNGPDGRRIRYLKQPLLWQSRDPVVYEHLREYVLDKGIRSVNVIERSNVLPNCRFFKRYIKDDIKLRSSYFKQFFEFAKDADLVFFDPDNGLEVKSVPFGKRRSAKFIYWAEVEQAYKFGYSLLLYQQFPHISREIFIESLVRKCKELDGIDSVFSYRTNHVVFLLLPQSRHLKMFIKSNLEVSQKWGDLIRVNRY
jgi:hypothetical protein